MTIRTALHRARIRRYLGYDTYHVVKVLLYDIRDALTFWRSP